MDGFLRNGLNEVVELPFEDVHPSSPFRKPTWRWQVAQHLADRNDPMQLPWSDPWIEQAVEYLQCGLISAEALREEADPVWLPIHLAAYLHNAGSGHLRHELEARLLTAADARQIAAMCGLAPELVEAYEALFFDVRDRLRHRSYIFHQVIGSRLYTGFDPNESDVLWKLIAFQGGNVALDAILDLTWQTDRPKRLDQISEYFAEHAEAVISRQLLLASLALQTAELTIRDLRQLMNLLDELGRSARDHVELDGLLIGPGASCPVTAGDWVERCSSRPPERAQEELMTVPNSPVPESPPAATNPLAIETADAPAQMQNITRVA